MSPAPGAASPDGRQTGGYHRSFTDMPIYIDISTIVDLNKIVKGKLHNYRERPLRAMGVAGGVSYI